MPANQILSQSHGVQRAIEVAYGLTPRLPNDREGFIRALYEQADRLRRDEQASRTLYAIAQSMQPAEASLR